MLLGTSAWQNLFWLPALYLAARRLLALALATRRMDASGMKLLAGCAAVQAWPVLAAVMADSLDVAFPRFFRARHGLNALGFGVGRVPPSNTTRAGSPIPTASPWNPP